MFVILGDVLSNCDTCPECERLLDLLVRFIQWGSDWNSQDVRELFNDAKSNPKVMARLRENKKCEVLGVDNE